MSSDIDVNRVIGYRRLSHPATNTIITPTHLVVLVVVLVTAMSLTACGGTDSGTGSGGTRSSLYTVDASAGPNGSISPALRQVIANDTTTFTVTPDSGFFIAEVLGCGGTLAGNTYTTGAITEDCTVSASFSTTSQGAHSVYASAGPNGSISPALQEVENNATTTFTVTPDSGFFIAEVLGCGGTLAGNTYTTGAITGDCTVSASFSTTSQSAHSVYASAGPNGSISPALQEVENNATTTFTVTADSGFFIAEVLGCGGTLAGNTYTTGAITEDCTVSASFSTTSQGAHSVYASAGPNGSISPALQLVENNATTTFTVTPDSGFFIAEVLGCGGTLAGNTYTTGAITEDCTVSASFSTTSQSAHSVYASAGPNGSISPALQQVENNATTTFTVTADSGFFIAEVLGCGGTLAGNTYTTGAITEDCTVSASFSTTSPDAHSVYASAGPNGSISPALRLVIANDTTTFTVTPDSGFFIAEVLGCGGTLAGNTYTTGVITEDCTVSASFSTTSPDAHSVYASAGPNGSISPALQQVENNATTTFTVTADSGFFIAEVLGCGGTLAGNTYTTGVITEDCTVSASFSTTSPDAHSVYASAGPNGSISPALQQVENNATTTFTVTADSGFFIAEVLGCGGTLAGNTYTTGAITEDCTVSASFSTTSQGAHSVYASAGPNGSISPALQQVENNATTTFTVTPDSGFFIAEVLGCGGTLAGNTYTTGAITGDCTVSASFSTTSQSAHSVYASAGPNGSISPALQQVENNATTTFTVTPDSGFFIAEVLGCGGTLAGNTYTTGAITEDCTVSASFSTTSQGAHSVYASAGPNGSISPALQLVENNATTTFTVTPDSGFFIAEVLGCGGTLAGNTYTTGAITEDCTVSASFSTTSQGAHGVYASAGPNGSISPALQLVENNATTTFTVTPDSGFFIAEVLGCSGTLAGNTYTTGVITEDCTVSASFSTTSPDAHSVYASAGPNGSISPALQQVENNATTTFTVTADSGFFIAEVLGCGGTLAGNTYTTGAITEDCTVSASFSTTSQGAHSVYASAGPNGSISPALQLVENNATTTFTVTPDSGFFIAEVLGCGGTLAGNTYTTGAITEDCTVSASFSTTSQSAHSVYASAGPNGSISPALQQVENNATTTFTVTADSGFFIAEVLGCGGTLAGNTYTTGAITEDCTVSASFSTTSPDAHSVYASAGPNGSISPALRLVIANDTTTFTVTPDSGFFIAEVLGCGGTLAGNTYTTGVITEDCTVSASFSTTSPDAHSVYASAGPNGSISPALQQVENNATTTFTVTADSGFFIAEVLGCGGTLAGNTYTTGVITEDCTVSASFSTTSPDAHSVYASAGPNGSISPALQQVENNATTTFTVTPDSGFFIAEVLGCGGTLAGNTYTTGAITEDCTVSASFSTTSQGAHSVYASAGPNGSISPALQLVENNATTTFTVTPDSGFFIAEVIGCGGTLAGNTYTTGAITEDCTVSASFSTTSQSAHSVYASAGPNGSISPALQQVENNATTTFTVTPDSGFFIAEVLGCGGTLAGNTYTTGAITEDCTVSASFSTTSQGAHSVYASAGPNGSISPALQLVENNATTTFTVTADSGFFIAEVLGCGGTLAGNTYTTGAITEDCTVSASFSTTSQGAHGVYASAGPNGSISPALQLVENNATTTFTVTPDSGFFIAEVLGCGGTLAGNTYTTGAITEDCTVSASFSTTSQSAHSVYASAGPNGSISPALQEVENNATTTFTVTPDSGFFIAEVLGCGGTLAGNTYTTGAITEDCTVSASFSTTSQSAHSVYASAGPNGSISPALQLVENNATTTFTVTPDSGFFIAEVLGCGGTLAGNTYTTGAITEDCTVSASFSTTSPDAHSVYAISGPNGSIGPALRLVENNATTTFTVTADSGFFIEGVIGCGGTLAGNTYTTGTITEDCNVIASFAIIPDAPALTLSFTPVKNFQFSWTDLVGPDYYRLLEDPDGISGFVQVGSDISQGTELVDHVVSLYKRMSAKYILQACFGAICINSDTVSVSGTMLDSIGYFKATNSDQNDEFGASVSISADGNTLAVGAIMEDSNATDVNSTETNNSKANSGAVYVFVRDGTNWSRQAYLKASVTDRNDEFGGSVSISADGNTLAVGATNEDSSSSSVNTGQADNSADESGAVYVFVRNNTTWSQQAYLKALNSEADDEFGGSVSISADGDTLAIGARNEDSNATGVNTGSNNNSADQSGAVYVFVRSVTVWSQQAYLKASNSEAGDEFGASVSISGHGNTLAVGATNEDSDSTSVDIGQADNSADESGAVYVFERDNSTWSQQAYLKAGNSETDDEFGGSVSISADGDTLAIGARNEDSNATGVNIGQADNSADESGAVYVFERDNSTWSQQAYLKAGNSETDDEFGGSVSISADGDTLAVGARLEDSNAGGINDPLQSDNSLDASGAVYVFERDNSTWSSLTWIKAHNTGSKDEFGRSVSISTDGNTLAVAAPLEASDADGVDGDQDDNSANRSGAVYTY